MHKNAKGTNKLYYYIKKKAGQAINQVPRKLTMNYVKVNLVWVNGANVLVACLRHINAAASESIGA